MNKDCIFCQIVAGEIPSFKVWGDENSLAFLSIHPIKKGHTLVIPKKHSPYTFEMEEKDYLSLMSASKNVAKLLKRAFQPKTGKVGSLVYGLDVEHVHIHLVPIDKAGDLNFSNQRPASQEELQKTLEKIQAVG